MQYCLIEVTEVVLESKIFIIGYIFREMFNLYYLVLNNVKKNKY